MLKKLSFLIICLVSMSFAQVPEKPNAWINDYADILSSSEEQRLNQQLRALEQRSSNQIFAAIFPALPEGEYLEGFATKIFDKWRPGLGDQANGLLILIALKERKIKIETGYGLEDVITDAQAGAVIRDQMGPYFRKSDYYGGINAALQVLIPAAEGKYKIPVKQKKKSTGKGTGISGLIVLFIFIMIIIRFFRGGPRNYGTRRRGSFMGPVFFGGFGSSGGSGFSSGGFGGGGGGFSGGFGGLSGGGGASGGW